MKRFVKAPSARPILVALATTLLVAVVSGVTAASAAAPVVTVEDATGVGYSVASVEGTVNPEGQSTSWRFQYATEADFSDAQDGPSGSTENSETVSGQLTGLQPETTYHLRLLAENGDGESEAVATNTFETLGPVTKPTVSIDSPSLISAQDGSFAFTGHVNPGGTDPAFATEWHFDCEPSCGSPAGGTISADESNHLVEAEVAGLKPKTTYTVTLHASNQGGEETAEATFKTPAGPPLVEAGVSLVEFDRSITLRGTLDLRGSALSDCHFAFGLDENYGHNVPCAMEFGEARANLPAATLTPAATYHFQLLVTTVGGSAHSEDATFKAMAEETSGTCPNEAIRVEQHSTYLPDCRAFEQVSPVDKQGADVLAFSPRTRASADGEAVEFVSLGGFADARGAGVAFEYLARRGPTAWSTQAITPTVPSQTIVDGSASLDALYDGDFSPDLGAGVFFAPHALTGTPASVAGVPNLYLRTDLHTPGAGTYQLLTGCPLCDESDTSLPPAPQFNTGLKAFAPFLVGMSPDGGQVAFESAQRLTADTPPQSPECGGDHFFEAPSGFFCVPHLYEWDHGQLRLAGVLPDGTPADVSFAGTGRYGAARKTYTPHVVSDRSDGHTRVEFTQPTDGQGRTLDDIGSSELFAFGQYLYGGKLFQRIDGSQTVMLNRSERTACLPEPEPQACADEFAPAGYLEATPDGRRVFLSTDQTLTDDAANAPGNKVYMYDASKPAADPHNLSFIGNGSALAGTGGDGHFAYLLHYPRIRAWHDGEIRDLGELPDNLANELPTDAVPQDITSRTSRVTPDGRYLIFPNDHSPFPGGYDHGHCNGTYGCREIYVYSAEDGLLACASCNPTGAPATGDATVKVDDEGSVSHGFPHGSVGLTNHQSEAISADGRHVFFSSAESLVPRDTNGSTYDAYEYDTVTGEVNLLSSGTSDRDSLYLDSSADGRDVFIATTKSLVGHDTDKAVDLYDVRVGGGYPEPVPVPALCAGEACQGAQAPTPPAPTVGSGREGAGNRKPPRRCPKGRHPKRVHGKTRCVKPKRHHHRTADNDRRASR